MVKIPATVAGWQSVGWILGAHRHSVTAQIVIHNGCIICFYVRQALRICKYCLSNKKCPACEILSSPEVCQCVFLPFTEYIEPLASILLQGREFNLVFSIHCLILVEQSLQNPVPENWDVIPYICWLGLMFSRAAFDMIWNVKLCFTLSPMLEDRMTHRAGLWLQWRWTEYGGNSYTNFSSSMPPNIDTRFCMLIEKGIDLSLTFFLFSRITNSTKYLCHISIGIQLSETLIAFFSSYIITNQFYLLEILIHSVPLSQTSSLAYFSLVISYCHHCMPCR